MLNNGGARTPHFRAAQLRDTFRSDLADCLPDKDTRPLVEEPRKLGASAAAQGYLVLGREASGLHW